ncbi:MAG: hypothetical protein K2O03_13785 [Lachnospiraceae bacterium]|nr:hypothetical protein [Lachnospiraceae bacterium]
MSERTYLWIEDCKDKASFRFWETLMHEILYHQERGSVYSDYAMIPFDMNPVEVVSGAGRTVVDDYEKLKEWWGDEE